MSKSLNHQIIILSNGDNLINAVPREWNNLIGTDDSTVDPPKCQHHLYLNRNIPLEKQTAKFKYILKILHIKEKPTYQQTILVRIEENETD